MRGRARQFIYFITYEDGPIKIGKARNASARLKELQTAHPWKLEIIGVMAGHENLERALHARFSHIRMNGEWFRRTEEIMNFICDFSCPTEATFWRKDVSPIKEQLNDARHRLAMREDRLKLEIANQIRSDMFLDLKSGASNSMYRWCEAANSLLKILDSLNEYAAKNGLTVYDRNVLIEIRRILDSALDMKWRDSERFLGEDPSYEEIDDIAEEWTSRRIQERIRTIEIASQNIDDDRFEKLSQKTEKRRLNFGSERLENQAR